METTLPRSQLLTPRIGPSMVVCTTRTSTATALPTTLSSRLKWAPWARCTKKRPSKSPANLPTRQKAPASAPAKKTSMMRHPECGDDNPFLSWFLMISNIIGLIICEWLLNFHGCTRFLPPLMHRSNIHLLFHLLDDPYLADGSYSFPIHTYVSFSFLSTTLGPDLFYLRRNLYISSSKEGGNCLTLLLGLAWITSYSHVYLLLQTKIFRYLNNSFYPAHVT